MSRNKILDFFKWFWKDGSASAARFRQIVKLAFLAILFAVLFLFVDFKEVILAIASADLKYLLVSFLLIIPILYLTALQLRILTKKQGIEASTLEIVWINLSISFYLLFVPGMIIGGGMRWYKLSQPQGKRAEALAAVAFNRLVEAFFFIVMGFCFWFLSGQQGSKTTIWVFVLLIVGCIFFWIVTTRASIPLAKLIGKEMAVLDKHHFLSWLVQKVQKLLLAITSYADFPVRDILLLILVGMLKTLIAIYSFWIMALSVGITIPFVDMGWIRSVIFLVNLLPFSIGGLGYREVSLIFMLGTFGISAELALAFSFLIFIRTLLVGLVGGLIEAGKSLRGREKIPKEPLKSAGEFPQISTFEEPRD